MVLPRRSRNLIQIHREVPSINTAQSRCLEEVLKEERDRRRRGWGGYLIFFLVDALYMSFLQLQLRQRILFINLIL